MCTALQFLSHTSMKFLRCRAVRGLATDKPQLSGLSFGMWNYVSSLGMWQSSNRIRQRLNFERFQQIQYSMNVLSALLLNANSWKNPCSMTDFTRYAQTARACRLTFFLKFNLSYKLQLLNVQHNFCSVMCYIVLIWRLILLTLGNSTVTLLFNYLNQCITFRLFI